MSAADTPSRGIRLAAIAHDCHECNRNRTSLHRLTALTRRRAHAALAGGHTDPFARATRALDAAQARYDDHLQRNHDEGAAA